MLLAAWRDATMMTRATRGQCKGDSAGAATPTESVTRWSAPPNDNRPIRRARVDLPGRHFARPSYAQRDGVAFRVVRLIWLTALLARRDPVRIADYQWRFGMSVRSFRRDIALLRNAGIYIDSAGDGDYRMLCFLMDSDLA